MSKCADMQMSKCADGLDVQICKCVNVLCVQICNWAFLNDLNKHFSRQKTICTSAHFRICTLFPYFRINKKSIF
jgi:hypothetical protein